MRVSHLLHRLRELLSELVMVVLGILIAFALNSWWEGREAAQRREAHLRALEADFQENVVLLTRYSASEEKTSDASRDLFNIAQRPGPIPADSAFNLIGRVFSSARFEPVMGAYEGVVASGGLTQLDDPQLAAELARFAASLRNTYTLDYSEALYSRLIEDAEGRLGFIWRSVARADSSAPRLSGGEAAPPTQAELSALLRDPRIQDALAIRAFSERDVARTYRVLEKAAEQVLARVRRDLRG